MSNNSIKLKILYVENDKEFASNTKLILELENFEVQIAANGLEGLHRYKEWKPDILLVDLDMPVMDGLEFTQRVREKDTQTHIIIYTSHGEPEKEIKVLDAGADEFVSKSRSPEVLVAHFNRLREKIVKCMNKPKLYYLSTHTIFNSITRIVTTDGEQQQLKNTESRLLQLLGAKINELVEREFILKGVWGNSSLGKDSEIKKYISLLRKYLKNDPTLTIECHDSNYILICKEQE